jgi:hypothetical protein
MPTPTAASEFESRTEQLAAAALIAAQRLWRLIATGSLMASWSTLRAPLAAQLAATQITAARAGVDYVPAVLDELGIDPAASARVNPRAFAVGSSGMPLLDVLDSVPKRALKAYAESGPDAGMAAGLDLLEGIIETQVADAARLASSVRMVATPAVSGYVRMVEPGACSRCVILAGRRYRTLEPFPRHDRCRCRHIPAAEDLLDDVLTDPRAYFDSLTKDEQDRAFTKAGARAIRDGADISQVVNARRGALGLTPAGGRLTAAEKKILRNGNEQFGHLRTTRLAGRDVYLTTEGTTKRGWAGQSMGNFQKVPGQRYRRSARQRLLPESIYQIAADREDAIRLLRLYGYVI